MTKRATSVVSIAAALALGAGSLCWSQNQPGQADQPPQPSGQADQSGQQPQGAQGTDQDEQQMHAAMKEWHQQVKQIVQQGGPTAPDKLFLLRKAMEDRMESRISDTAAQKSQNPQVKQIAQRISQDHQQMQQQLQQVAQQVGVQIPQTEPMHENDGLTKLYTSLPADQFDQRYIAFLNACHARDVAAFEAEARIAQAAPVKQFAQQQLPKLQQHYQQIQQTAVTLGVIAPGEAVPAGGQIKGGETGGGK
ncbi:MAG: putative outer membrane protein-like protein [Phycisphaerales bacterium]|nr:putative outer membrane protein-like protein [Phycisphaerales bacterium]MDB5354944.1 putative outer membrane protein-like protein [Phycisphaerales bacterium]